MQQNRITDHSVKDPGSLGRKIVRSLVTAKGNAINTIPETTRRLGFNAFTLGSDTLSCGAKAVSRRVVL